jgi:hypothetical protein
VAADPGRGYRLGPRTDADPFSIRGAERS